MQIKAGDKSLMSPNLQAINFQVLIFDLNFLNRWRNVNKSIKSKAFFGNCEQKYSKWWAGKLQKEWTNLKFCDKYREQKLK